jgi:predicted DCC family thiol-disulfide oxidoreductase YuxK
MMASGLRGSGSPGSSPGSAIVLYDSDCGFCKRLLSKFLAWDRHARLRPVALQSEEAAELLAGMDEAERMASWHLLTPDGRLRSGGAAAAPLMRLLPGGAVPAWLAERIPNTVDRAYRWVAANRSALSHRVPGGERAKARAERRIGERS